MKKNYALSLASNGDMEVFDTVLLPGVRDCYTKTRGGTFTLYVAPADYIDKVLGLTMIDRKNNPEGYELRRIHKTSRRKAEAILRFFRRR